MDRFPSLSDDDFKDLLIARDPALWTKMEQSALFSHIRVLRGDGVSLAGGREIAEMWFAWWLENDDKFAPLLEGSKPGDGTLEELLNERYTDPFDIFGLGEYAFVKEAGRKVPEWMAAHSLWKTRPDSEALRLTGDRSGQVSLMLADGFTFDEADTWTLGAGRFAPQNPSTQIHRYRALTSQGVPPQDAIELLVEHVQRPVWQILLLRDGVPLDYVDVL